jgi:hypothetical protein
MQGYCFASLAMTRLQANKERERDRCKNTIDCLSTVLRFAAIPLSHPSPIMCCHCEERSDEATKSRFSDIQLEVPIFPIIEDLVVAEKK